ncbi:hypothetical protein M1L60_06210 [Actinoplanes sp. TRM 88003]|uniref:Uncharacterized protein n=1 Tax=Paractinoplanes aksuensis TaxID=2939490 RepID=A0ABT1DH69_9ACTN|nr:hypothetical protein [Actinoplanes aksuensis]MCO8270185.1 hypothetical protein [Actinoplanes aksuensis]
MTDDDDLRARLRRADPAADLPPYDTSHLLETTMTATTTAPRRPMLTLAAAALVLIAALGTWFLLRPSGDPAGPVAAPTVTELTAPGIAAKCVEPSADRLKEAADFAFAGTVTGVDGGTVTLKVTKVYRGAAADQVRIAQTGDISETMLGSGKFETGKDYLVASARGSMLICGYSGEASAPGLPQLYDTAF